MLQAALPERHSTQDMLRLSELMVARFSHDITGPIGAVNNGAEFLQEGDEEMLGHAVELIASSAQEAVSKIMFYRQCYGVVRGDSEMKLSDLQTLANDFFKHSQVTVEWQMSDSSLSREKARLVMNMLYLTSGSLIRGGKVLVHGRSDEKMQHVSVKAEGQTVKYEDEWMAVLKGEKGVQDLTPRSVQVYLTLLMATQHGADIYYQINEQLFELTAKLKQTILVPEA